MKHVARQIVRSAAAAGIASFAAGCIIPPPGVGPRPQEAELPAPDVVFSTFDSSPASVGSGIVTYSTTRDAYTAAFEVDQRGIVRVLSPSSPDDHTRSQAGTSYVLVPMLHSIDREYLSPSTDFSRVPFVFVLTSDTPLNLSAFGTRRAWSHTVTVGARAPDSAIAAVAQWVLPDAPVYGSDFAYVGPALRPLERRFVADCARPVDDVHDYSYYRDLWAVFTPADQRLSINPSWLFSPALSWSSYSLLPLATYRAQFARNAFYAGCASDPSGYGIGGYTAYSSVDYPGAGLFGGYGPYGFGYGYGYPIGYGVVIGNGVPRGVAPLHVPRTPNALGALQVVGTTGPNAPTTAGVAKAAPVPTRLAWRPLDGGRLPGEVQFAPRTSLHQPLPLATRPIIDRRGVAAGPFGDGMRVSAGRSGPEFRPGATGGSGHVSAQAPAPRSGGSGSVSGSSGGSSASHGSASSPAPASGGSSQSSGARSGRAQ